MRAQEFTQHLQDLVIFDIDDTLLHTTARIRVVDSNGRVLRELTNQEFNNYQLQPGETFDFGEFRSAEKFQRESQPIEPMIRKLKTILNYAGRARVIMLTARADFDDKEKFLQTFRDLGIDMSRIHVHRAGNLPGNEPPAQKKAVWVRRYLDTGRYGHVRLYDDSMSNLRVFRSLKNEYPDVDFRAIYVGPRGDTTTVNENKSSGISKIVQDFVSSGIGKSYQKHDCKTVTRAFVKWASTNNISTQVLSLAPPHPDVIKKRPELRGKSGEGDGHIMPVVGGYALDFTARQFPGQAGYVYSNPLVTPIGEVSTVYKKIGGYFTYAPNWFIVDGKPATHYLGPLESIPSDIFNQNFGDELLEERRRNKKKAKFAYSGSGYWGGYYGSTASSEQSSGEGGVAEGTYDISDFKMNVYESMADFRKWMRSPKKNDRGMTRRIVDMYENIVVKDNILKEASQTFVKRKQQAKEFSENFKQFDEREKVQIQLGNKIALLSSTVIPDDNSSRIELSGFTTPKKIVKINLDNEDKIDSIKFDDGSIFPEAAEFTTVGGVNITNTIFFPDKTSASRAYTAIWMLISNLEGQGWKIEHYINEDVAEGWSEKYKKSINCDRPKGFSQRAHCQGRKKK